MGDTSYGTSVDNFSTADYRVRRILLGASASQNLPATSAEEHGYYDADKPPENR